MIVLAAFFASSGGAMAADWTVDDPSDVAGTCAPDPDNGGCSLRQAISATNASPGPDRIFATVATALNLIGSDNTNTAGDLDVTDDLTIIGTIPAPNLVGAYWTFGAGERVMDVPSAGDSLTLQDFSLANGQSVGANNGGGDLRFNGGSGDKLTLDGTTVSGGNVVSNAAGNFGGGIRVSGGDAEITGSTVGSNRAATISSTGDGSGAGLYFSGGGTLDVTNSDFSSNRAGGSVFSTAPGFGGAIALGSGTVTIDGSTFSGNVAGGGSLGDATGDGGALYVGGSTADVTIRNSSFDINKAGGNTGDGTGRGGAIFSNSSLAIENTTFNGNLAGVDDTDTPDGEGGAIRMGTGGTATLDVTGGDFTGNEAGTAGGLGGAIEAPNGGALTIAGTSFADNVAAQAGGAIRRAATGAPVDTIADTTVDGNTAGPTIGRGGGFDYETAGTVTITGSTFSGNTGNSASGQGLGGGLSLNSATAAGTFTLQNSTIDGNTASGADGGDGGGIAVAVLHSGTPPSVTIAHSTLSANTAGVGPNPDAGNLRYAGSTADKVKLGGSIVTGGIGDPGTENCDADNSGLSSLGGNIEGPPSTSAAGQCELDQANDLAEGVDPLLAGLADNGGPTLTRALQAGSPALDIAPAANCPATDQRGYPRTAGVNCDAGAYEAFSCPSGFLNAPGPFPGACPPSPSTGGGTPPPAAHKRCKKGKKLKKVKGKRKCVRKKKKHKK
jgi:hypothetical protein